MKLIANIISFYIDGFKGMMIGKQLWGIIFIKLFIMFAVLKVFFFPDFLHTRFDTDEERGEYVMDQLIQPVEAEAVKQEE